MHQIASKFTLLESRLQSQASMNDRLERLESKLASHSTLHNRVDRLETQLKPDPEHDRLITRINAKLDMIEKAQQQQVRLSSNASPSSSSSSAKLSDHGEVKYLQDRIDRLTALRARYAKEERELLA
jgi:hypothetical protein